MNSVKFGQFWTWSFYQIAQDQTENRLWRDDVENYDQIECHKEGRDHIAEDNLAMEVVEIREGNIDIERQEEEDETEEGDKPRDLSRMLR